MPVIEKRHQVNHPAAKMFDLVADVESYPEFVPLCERLVIRDRKQKQAVTILIAEMEVAYKLFREQFTSQVVLDKNAFNIDVSYVDGPFRHLHNHWHFVSDSDLASTVEFHLDYEFRSRMLEMVMGSVFEIAFSKFTTAFEQRADAVYGSV